MIGCPNCNTPRESLSMSPCPECGHQIGPQAEVLPPIQCTKGEGKLPEGVEMVWSNAPTIDECYPYVRLHPDSPAYTQAEREREAQKTQQDKQSDTQIDTPTPENEMGNIPAMPASSDAADAATTRRGIETRFMKEGRWFANLSKVRDDMYRLARKQGMNKPKALQWVYGELDRLYPPLKTRQIVGSVQVKEVNSLSTIVESARGDDGSIQGLNSLPSTWPELPANASLQAEVAWVQANRLRIVSEQPGRATVVSLDKALSAAPSWAALGWLETSIRSYAKFVDVAARATSSDDSETGVIRRERMAIEEMKALLAEMDGDQPGK